MKTTFAILSLIVMASTSFASTDAKQVDLNQCLAQAKIMARAVDQVNETGRMRSTEDVRVEKITDLIESSSSDAVDLIYTFGDTNGESFLEIFINADDGCKFVSATIISQD